MFVLSSPTLYGRNRSDIARALKVLFGGNSVNLDHKLSVLEALDLYETTRLDFEDCLAVAHASRVSGDRIFTYDRALGRVAGVTRLEPQFEDESDSKSE